MLRRCCGLSPPARATAIYRDADAPSGLMILAAGGELLLERRQFGERRVGIDGTLAFARRCAGRIGPVRRTAARAAIAIALVAAAARLAFIVAAAAEFAFIP